MNHAPVWIIDDDKSIRWVLEKALSRAGIGFESFVSADDALNAMYDVTPQVVISDIRMPGGSGLQLLQKLGAQEICSVFVEGGGQVNFSLLAAGLVDKVHAFIAPKLIGGQDALTPVEGAGFSHLSEAVELECITMEQLAGDILLTGYPRK